MTGWKWSLRDSKYMTTVDNQLIIVQKSLTHGSVKQIKSENSVYNTKKIEILYTSGLPNSYIALSTFRTITSSIVTGPMATT